MQATGEAGPAALICVYSSQQLVPALSALLCHRRQVGAPDDAPAIVLVWCSSSLAEEVSRRRVEAVAALLAPLKWITVLPIAGAMARSVQSRLRVRDRAREVARLLAGVEVGQVFYCHDITADFIAQAAMRACPDATRICYGDAWGVVYTNRHFERETYPFQPSMWRQPAVAGRNCVARLRRRLARGTASQTLDADLALAILPLDPGGDFFRRVPCRQVRVGIVDEVVAMLREAVPAGFPAPRGDATLMLVGSYCESQLCDVEQELALYDNAVRAHVEPGGEVLLKPHPSGQEAKLQRLASLLEAGGYRVQRLDTRFDEYPVELLSQSWAPATILSFSYSSVSLSYLGYPDVVHALTEELIASHFPGRARQWLMESNALYVGQVELAQRARAQELAT